MFLWTGDENVEQFNQIFRINSNWKVLYSARGTVF